MDTLFQIVTMTIPKAGIQLGALPLTLSIVLFIFVILKNPNQTALAIQRTPAIGFWYGVLLISCIISFCLGFGQMSAFTLAQKIIVAASPLAIVASTRIPAERMMKITCIALIVVNLYGFAQFAFSVTALNIPGITSTYGQDVESKPIGMQSDTGFAVKIPSTFQNGAYLGIFCILGICLMLIWQSSARWKATRLISIILGIGGLFICGSRSIILPSIIIGIILLIETIKKWPRRMKETYLVGVGFVALFLIFIVITFFPKVVTSFIDRNIIGTLNDPTATGRTTQWADIWEYYKNLSVGNLLEVVATGNAKTGGEGIPQLFVQCGLFATISFIALFISVIVSLWRNKDLRPLSLGVLCVLLAFFVDSSFDFPPNVMNVFLFSGIGLAYYDTHVLRE